MKKLFELFNWEGCVTLISNEDFHGDCVMNPMKVGCEYQLPKGKIDVLDFNFEKVYKLIRLHKNDPQKAQEKYYMIVVTTYDDCCINLSIVEGCKVIANFEDEHADEPYKASLLEIDSKAAFVAVHHLPSNYINSGTHYQKYLVIEGEVKKSCTLEYLEHGLVGEVA